MTTDNRRSIWRSLAANLLEIVDAEKAADKLKRSRDAAAEKLRAPAAKTPPE